MPTSSTCPVTVAKSPPRSIQRKRGLMETYTKQPRLSRAPPPSDVISISDTGLLLLTAFVSPVPFSMPDTAARPL